jgi:hypothetical protein
MRLPTRGRRHAPRDVADGAGLITQRSQVHQIRSELQEKLQVKGLIAGYSGRALIIRPSFVRELRRLVAVVLAATVRGE